MHAKGLSPGLSHACLMEGARTPPLLVYEFNLVCLLRRASTGGGGKNPWLSGINLVTLDPDLHRSVIDRSFSTSCIVDRDFARI